jgi:3-oxoacyl-(acyl-carrier-protein) synthase/SAM-dependent methyltransferase/NADP-dependent 3-hydroxy acid dehydrogenase YdfG/acyl carrier protein
VLANGIVDGIELFDARLFGFSDNEATVTDPQQRLSLEVAWQCLVDAGIDPRAVQGSVGVFTSSSSSTYLINELLPRPERNLSAGGMPLLIRNDKDHTASLIAYKLGLTGPAVNIGCGCSGGLAAVHLALHNLRTWQCDVALCGASSLLVPQKQGHFAMPNGIYSHDGYCRVFDAAATGTVGGSGVGFLALKRLDDAVRDGDRIYATILGSAINNDGHAKAGYSAPSLAQQAEVIALAHSVSDVSADTINFVEAHGTGTALGDPIEVQALTRAFSRTSRDKNFCALGSVKSNIGHADVAAGVAGLIKTALALWHEFIPPTLHFSRPNPELRLDESAFYVNSIGQRWEPRHGVRRAGVTSLGMGGTNVHVVLQDFSPEDATRAWSADCYLYPLSAHSEVSLQSWYRSIGEFVTQDGVDAGVLAYTLARRRPSMKVRRAFVAANIAELRDALIQDAASEAAPERRARFVLVLGDRLSTPRLPQALLRHGLEDGLHALACVRWLQQIGVPLDAIVAFGDGTLDELQAVRSESSVPVRRGSELALMAREWRRESGSTDEWHVFDPFGQFDSVAQFARSAENDAPLSLIGPQTRGSRPLLAAIGAAWERGASVNWQRLYGFSRQWMELPEYPFQRQRYWTDSPAHDSQLKLDALCDAARECYAEYTQPSHFEPMAAFAGLEQGLDEICRLAVANVIATVPGSAGMDGRQLAEKLRVHARHRKFFESLWTRCRESLPQPGDLRERAQALAASYPRFAGLIEVLRGLGADLVSNLTEPMRGSLAFRQLLNDGSLQRALTPQPPFSNMEAACRAAARLVSDIANAEQRALRVLEVGAGRMILTQFMEELIRSSRVEYWITDVSQSLVEDASKAISERGIDARTAVLDITRRLADQNPDAGAFDLIVGLNVVHVCPQLDAALTNLRDALAANGRLLLLESTSDNLWTTFIWGWSEGWWDFADAHRRVSPLMNGASWLAMLKRLAPTVVASITSPTDGGDTGAWIAQFAEPGKASEAVVVKDVLADREASPEQWLYKPCFIRKTPPRAAQTESPGTWVVFTDGDSSFEASMLAALGDEARVLRVYPGDAYAQLTPSAYRVRPTSSDDLRALLAAIGPRLTGQVRILFAWRLDGDARRFYSMLALAQALGPAISSACTIVVVTQGLHLVMGNESLNPAESLVSAAAKIIPREYWNCECRVLDIEESARTVADTWTQIRRLATEASGPPFAAIRGGNYWIPWYAPVSALRAQQPAQRLRKEGVYVIFGGLGGLGFSIACHLARQFNARLVLVSRSADAADAQISARMNEIRRLGGECVVLAADITVPEDVEAALHEAEQVFGTIHGVIHSAGEIDDGGVIQGRSFEHTARKLAPKVHGAQLLAAALASRTPDFLVLFSSIGSALYKLKFGEVAYVGGNDYLVAFAQDLARRVPYFVQVIQWTDWDSAGMWSRARTALHSAYTATSKQRERLEHDLLHALTYEQGTSTFSYALQTDEPHVLVSVQPLEALLRRHEQYQPADYAQYLDRLGLARRASEEAAPVVAAAPQVPAGEKDIRTLCAIWEEVIGCKVEPESDFFAIGGDSLLALRVISRVADEFAVSLPLNAFFSSSTLKDMYSFIDNLRWAATMREASSA